ncbi:sigma-54-dependent transcriptional regulator [Nitratidesulfovibrio vulgaris]|uniref:sigma-54-dependent transcriptional regulator n=1 Tax=Nitratidesulfovibrio vulgaris TaxID=881 RepID=UPI0023014885|nr:sigma-54 dependent transcriptional regulator [Nitratidesulfovibrio vulgaris]WCB46492.1 sigma-54 dependent transcriptional regulator [Nitratidesulfovibrio vulgaris]
MNNASHATILIIEDEPLLSLTLGDHLRDRGFQVIEASDGQMGLELFHAHTPSLVTLDLRMDPMDGHEVLAAIRKQDQDTPVIIISGQGQMEDVIRALRAGAFDYIQKPVYDMTILDHAIDRALERSALRHGNARLSRSFLADGPQRPEDFSHILTMNPRMRDIFRYCEAVAQSTEPVLITGETGVGKELLARALHRSSQYTGPFIAINVAGLDIQGFSDTLFGHVRGAFTGADRPRAGLMEKAAGGTLFLDEVGDLSQQAQICLLRVLQEKEYHPLGSDCVRPLCARVIAATNKELSGLRSDTGLRSDFFFRLATHVVTLPPLRERREDIPLLMHHFMEEACKALGRAIPDCSAPLLSRLKAYAFPGNVRELKGMIHDALGRCPVGPLTPAAFPSFAALQSSCHAHEPVQNPFEGLSSLPSLRMATECLISEAMRRSNGVQKVAASILGISPQALSERLRRR